MTRKLFFLATALFWLAVLGVWAASNWSPASRQGTPVVAVKRVSPAELAQHAGAGDCWMAIHGKVYDLTEFAKRHPGGDLINTIGGGPCP